ncbi:alanine--tRNA ligase [Candidatus Woesearchaeota archaeon]|nr:alanine--tRNA ligase [Candidatus Woesearchaeota archaeon]
MLPDKVIKKQFKEKASLEPEKYYATDVLKREGFKRRQCSACATYFWTVNDDQEVCGDASCQGGFNFLDDNPATIKLSYTQVWDNFKDQFSKDGYLPISRFPVIARWNPTMDFTIASIAAFQPFVVSGEAKPPAKKLVIPQFCLRFGDVDNVGITMSHLTGFVMIGQHQFVSPNEWDQNKAFEEIMKWLTVGLGLPKKEITFHEDAWAGGGNFGPCMEYFSRGVELGNQVYMMFEQDDEAQGGFKDLSLKVLDMGMGMERNAWFSQGTPTIYDATFPYVVDRLVDLTGVEKDEDFIRSYMPHGAYLNLDEVEDISQAWEDVAKKMNVSVEVLREKLEPMTAIYSIAEHSRSLLLALSDGGLPSNVGGGYNLRVILRRALSFIEKFNWDVDLFEVCRWHAEELSDLFPELEDALPDVEKILASEKRKFIEGRKRNKQQITQVLKKGLPSIDDLIKFYDSQGITPEEFVKAAKELGLKLVIPDNFYALVAEKHESTEQATATRKTDKLPVDETLPKTEILYYDDWNLDEFKAKILQVIPGRDEKSKYLIFDKTAFYPTSGGQLHDLGLINAPGNGVCCVPLLDCIKQNGYVLHLVEGVDFKVGDEIKGEINMVRRKQLTQHHTATHIINGAAKAILGNHIWQAGASKTLEKGRLDITHYEALTDEEMRLIEDKANEIIEADLLVKKELLPRDEAERRYGFRLYQGGAVPGQEIRVVAIEGFDIEACGGTHLNSTAEAESIKLLKSTKVQDGIVRIEFTAGNAAKAESGKVEDIVAEAGNLLDCASPLIPGRCEELFTKWKQAKKKKLELADFDLKSEEVFEGDVLVEAARILKTQPEHVVKTIKKFQEQLNQFKESL